MRAVNSVNGLAWSARSSLHFLRGGWVPTDKDVADCLQTLNTFIKTRCISFSFPKGHQYTQCHHVLLLSVWLRVQARLYAPTFQTRARRTLAPEGFSDGRAMNTLCLSAAWQGAEGRQEERKTENGKHSPAQRKTALRSYGPWWRHSWPPLGTQSGPTRRERAPRRMHCPERHAKTSGTLDPLKKEEDRSRTNPKQANVALKKKQPKKAQLQDT